MNRLTDWTSPVKAYLIQEKEIFLYGMLIVVSTGINNFFNLSQFRLNQFDPNLILLLATFILSAITIASVILFIRKVNKVYRDSTYAFSLKNILLFIGLIVASALIISLLNGGLAKLTYLLLQTNGSPYLIKTLINITNFILWLFWIPLAIILFMHLITQGANFTGLLELTRKTAKEIYWKLFIFIIIVNAIGYGLTLLSEMNTLLFIVAFVVSLAIEFIQIIYILYVITTSNTFRRV